MKNEIDLQLQRLECIRNLLVSHPTECLLDRYAQLSALRLAKRLGLEKEAIKIFLDLRLSWIARKTIWQRQWQARTKNINKAQHHDSILIREKYVKCVA